jgi:hypothetical protein
MKRHLPFALKSILLVCFAGFLLAGCCSTHCVDCIPHSKMPYLLYDKGAKYYLTDHVSIDQMIESQIEQDSIQKRWPEILREKFPNDKELLAYLDLHEKRLKELDEKTKNRGGTYLDHLWDMKTDMDQSHGELYYYYLLGKKGLVDAGNRPAVEDEEGYLILSKGKVFKKYVAGNGIVSESLLKERGLK